MPHRQSETHATVLTHCRQTLPVIRKGNYLLLDNILVPRSYSAAQVRGALLITHWGESGKWILQRDNSACRLLFYVFQFPSSLSTTPPPTFSHLHLNGIFVFSESIFSHLFPIQASRAQFPRAEPFPGGSKDWAGRWEEDARAVPCSSFGCSQSTLVMSFAHGLVTSWAKPPYSKHPEIKATSHMLLPMVFDIMGIQDCTYFQCWLHQQTEVPITLDIKTLPQGPSQTRMYFQLIAVDPLSADPCISSRNEETCPLKNWFPLRHQPLIAHCCHNSWWGSADAQDSSNSGHCFFLLFAVKPQYIGNVCSWACLYAKELLAYWQAELHPLEHKAPLVVTLMKASLKAHALTRFNLCL